MSLKSQYVPGETASTLYDKAQQYIYHRQHVLASKPTINSHIGSAYLPKHGVIYQRKRFIQASDEQKIQEQNLKLYNRIQHSKFNLSPIERKNSLPSSDETLSLLSQSKSRKREMKNEMIQSKNEKLLEKLTNARTNYKIKPLQGPMIPSMPRRKNPLEFYNRVPKRLLPKIQKRLSPRLDTDVGSSVHTSHSLDIQSLASLQSSSVSSLSSLPSLNLLDSIESKFGTDFPSRVFTARDVFINRSKRFGTLNTRYHRTQASSLQSNISPSPPPQSMVKERSRRQMVRYQSSRLRDVGDHHHHTRKNVLSRIKFLSLAKENFLDIARQPTPLPTTKTKHHSMVSHRSSTEAKTNTDSHTTTIASRVFAIPFDSNNCTIEVFIRNDIVYDENFGVRLIAPSHTSEQCLTIDQVSELLENHESHLPHRAGDEKHSVRFLFINIFRNHDYENSGWILYDKFAELLLNTDIGLNTYQVRYKA